MHGVVRIQMPIAQAQATAIGYHSSADGAIALKPLGHQGNEGVTAERVPQDLRRRRRPSDLVPARRRRNLGARRRRRAGHERLRAGRRHVIGMTPYIVAGHRFGSRIDIQPQSAPSLVVSVTQLRADPSLKVGSNVVSGATRIGAVVDLAKIERQALARYTNDAGNHVSIELRPAATLVLN